MNEWEGRQGYSRDFSDSGGKNASAISKAVLRHFYLKITSELASAFLPPARAEEDNCGKCSRESDWQELRKMYFFKMLIY